MNAFVFWLRWVLNYPITYHCEHGGYCFCEGLDNNHDGPHFRCRHCTNPLIVCRRCGTAYLDVVPPSRSRWIYRGLFRGWEHNGPCEVRSN